MSDMGVGGTHAGRGMVKISIWHVENVGCGRNLRVFERCTAGKIFTVPPAACFPPTCMSLAAGMSGIQPADFAYTRKSTCQLASPHPTCMTLAWHLHDTSQSQVRLVNSQVACFTQVDMLLACNAQLASLLLVPCPTRLFAIRFSTVFLACPTSNSQEGLKPHPNTQETFSWKATRDHLTPRLPRLAAITFYRHCPRGNMQNGKFASKVHISILVMGWKWIEIVADSAISGSRLTAQAHIPCPVAKVVLPCRNHGALSKHAGAMSRRHGCSIPRHGMGCRGMLRNVAAISGGVAAAQSGSGTWHPYCAAFLPHFEMAATWPNHLAHGRWPMARGSTIDDRRSMIPSKGMSLAHVPTMAYGS
jgi:hypothetical protein